MGLKALARPAQEQRAFCLMTCSALVYEEQSQLLLRIQTPTPRDYQERFIIFFLHIILYIMLSFFSLHAVIMTLVQLYDCDRCRVSDGLKQSCHFQNSPVPSLVTFPQLGSRPHPHSLLWEAILMHSDTKPFGSWSIFLEGRLSESISLLEWHPLV